MGFFIIVWPKKLCNWKSNEVNGIRWYDNTKE